MSILNYNEIRPRKYILLEDEPWEVLDWHVSRKQQNKPTNKTKLKNLINGRLVDYTFYASDTAPEAEITYRPIQYLYYQDKKNEYWFCDSDNPKNRFTLPAEMVGSQIEFIKEKSELEASEFTNSEGEVQIIGLKYPMKVELAVTEAPPGIKGDTATGGKKVVTLETGVNVNAPLFINVGDIISVNTETGEYSERMEKK